MGSQENMPHLPDRFPGIGALYQLVQSLITFDNLPDLLQAVADRTCAAVDASWVVLVTFDVKSLTAYRAGQTSILIWTYRLRCWAKLRARIFGPLERKPWSPVGTCSWMLRLSPSAHSLIAVSVRLSSPRCCIGMR